VTVRDGERLDLQAQPASVAEARGFVRRVLTDWGMPEAVDTVALLTSELATNAVLHARTAFAVLVRRDGDEVRVDVLDGSAVPPRRRQNTATAATGRGVAMVDRLSASWGATPSTELDGFAKGVWFAVPVAGDSESTWAGDWLDGLT
jgi:anti-sigma regulatory factor (Ser/Thr protein kinase)